MGRKLWDWKCMYLQQASIEGTAWSNEGELNIGLISIALPAAQSFNQGGRQYGSYSRSWQQQYKMMARIELHWYPVLVDI